MLSPGERIQLRDRAFAAWQDAKRLMDHAGHLGRVSAELRGDAQTGRLDSREARAATVRRVDQVLAELDHEAEIALGGVGLVAAHHIQRIGVLHDVVHVNMDRVYAAADAPAAVAMAIAHQPDVAVVDDDIAVTGGLDAMRIIHAYAPEAKLLLITDRAGSREHARLEGIATAAASASPEQLLTTLDLLVA